MSRREYNRAYYRANREAILKRDCEYYRANREVILKRVSEYHRANREAILKRQHEYYRANREAVLKPTSEWKGWIGELLESIEAWAERGFPDAVGEVVEKREAVEDFDQWFERLFGKRGSEEAILKR